MIKNDKLSTESREMLLTYLIEESECAILDLKNLQKVYENNEELVRMYSDKMLHYEFMISRLKRHLTKTRTPKQWYDSTLIKTT